MRARRGVPSGADAFGRSASAARVVALAVVALAVACSSDPDAERAARERAALARIPQPKNLVFLAVDTLRADHLGVFGGDPGRSPRIDELGATGVVFEHTDSHASWTLPSFAATLTSLYSSTNGCWDTETRLDESFETLPERFQAAGFDTYGVASHIFFNADYGLQQGFDAFDDHLAHKRDEDGWVPNTSPVVTREAIRWLDERVARGDDDPFLLFLHYFDPHLPYLDHAGVGTTPATEHARYESEITYTDGFVGRVLDALERNGLADETAIVFLSDHGEAWEEHAGVRRHAKSLFREELEVPLIVRIPGLAPLRVADRVRTVDLMPTLLDVFRIDRGEQPMEGVSLVGALVGEGFDAPPLLSEIRLHDDAHHVRSLVEDQWKLIEAKSGELSLYDLSSDPLEERDLASSEPERVRAMNERMRRLQARAEAWSARFDAAERLELDAETAAKLDALGYGGDSDGDDAAVPFEDGDASDEESGGRDAAGGE